MHRSGIGYSRREEPDITLAHIIDERFTVLVDSLSRVSASLAHGMDTKHMPESDKCRSER